MSLFCELEQNQKYVHTSSIALGDGKSPDANTAQ